MKNSVWIGKNKYGNYYGFSDKRPTINGGELCGNWHYTGAWLLDFFAIALETLEIVELIYDTETGKIEIKREREIGWYLTRESEDVAVFVRFWDGETWCACPKSKGWIRYSDSSIVVVSDKLPYNEYLRSLEL